MEFKANLLYDGEQKVRYLEQCRYDDSTKIVIDMWFRQAAKIEMQEGCDLSKFNRQQVYRLYKGLNSKSKITLLGISSFFSDYYNWRVSEGYIDAYNFSNQYDSKMSLSIIQEVVTSDLIRGKFMTPDDILGYLDIIPDPVNRFIVYAIYLGVYGNEFSDLVNLRIEDINEERKVVNLISGRQQPIDNLFIQLAKDADIQTLYYPEGIVALNNKKFPNRSEYDPSCYIIKSLKGNTENMVVDKQNIMSRLRVLQKLTGNKFLNGLNLYKSGLINYITKKFEPRGITFKEAMMTKETKLKYLYMEEIQNYIHEYGMNITVNSLRLQVVDYMDLFE